MRIMKSSLFLIYASFSIMLSVKNLSSSQNLDVGRQSKILELSAIDLFSLRTWNTNQISILGLRLGMGREEVRSTLHKIGAFIDEKEPGACLDLGCSVFRSGYIDTAVSVRFDTNDKVRTITITPWPPGTPVPPPGELITKKLIGETSRLINQYDEKLRVKLLGSENERWQKLHEIPDSFISIEDIYQYNCGLVIHVNRYQSKLHGVRAPRLERIEFVAPGPNIENR
jgi:hypothetical protein